ncbi:hypothetical protein FQN49_005741 [Arthroderma sp. PD_2]|nr:hypothetical protein FQN49_005741 [Arthroderma sp. PD_2]
MAEQRSRPPSVLLEPPPKGVELEDPGASDHNPESDDEHFSDATEGQASTSRQPSRSQSPVPRTRVEKLDSSPRHGEMPGSPAYQQRLADAVPDEIDIVGEEKDNIQHTSASPERPLTPGGTPIPITIVEKVDPSSPAYGEEPGTQAYESRKADFPPDRIFKLGDPRANPQLVMPENELEDATSDSDLPETLLSRVESLPKDGVKPQFTAHRRKPSDTAPDAEEIVLEVPGQSTSAINSPENENHSGDDSTELKDDDDISEHETGGGVDDDNDDAGFGDDFDDFKGGDGEDDHDEFGDFDDGFQEPEETYDNAILEPTTASILPSSQPILPPNWTKSRIRRLFLVSLGVPVDLDEILPASKQKKLVLPSMNRDTARVSGEETSGHGGTLPHSRSKRKHLDGQPRSSTSLDSNRSSSRPVPSTPRRKGNTPPPELDLFATRRLCDTTDAALDGFTDEEMTEHIQKLEKMTIRASEVLEYWLKKRDGQLGEKEAFEGVIENLVKHARQVRK